MKLYLTIDVEAHRIIDEISGADRDSLGTILRILGEENASATFFVDVCEVRKWGREFMQTTCARIQNAGHEIQLHVHPHHLSGDSSRWLLSEYSHAEQEVILSEAVEEFLRLTGKSARCFRAGGFGANESTLVILAEKGVVCDSSFLWRRPGCLLNPVSITGRSKYLGMQEVPLSPVIIMGTRKNPLRVSCLDFNWLPIRVITLILKKMRASGYGYAVVLMHSSSMYVRIGRKRLWYRQANERRLRHLLRFAAEQRMPAAVLTESDPADAKDGPVIVLNNPLMQYLVLLYQAIIGIGISAKFLAFVVANLLVAIGLVAAVKLLFCS